VIAKQILVLIQQKQRSAAPLSRRCRPTFS
jgi:hypothetical protein